MSCASKNITILFIRFIWLVCVALPSIHKDIKLKDPQIRSVTFIVDMRFCMTHNDILITIF